MKKKKLEVAEIQIERVEKFILDTKNTQSLILHKIHNTIKFELYTKEK